MKARAPGSSANLGPGFDTLAVALGLYVTVDAAPSSSLQIEATGEGAHLPRDHTHLAAAVAREVIGHDNVALTIDSEIPLARGLGSSSALVVATAAALGAEDPLAVAAYFDGHIDNAAASFSGGLIAATVVDGNPVATSLFLDPDIQFVVAIPDLQLETAAARDLLPKEIAREDAVFNLGRMGWLIGALADADNFTNFAMEDRIHQPHRIPLFPESPHIMEGMRDGGAVSACWSGAGPALLGVVTASEKMDGVVAATRAAMKDVGVDGVVLPLAPDLCGLQVE